MQDQYSEYERDPDFYVDLLVLYEKGQLRIQENHPAEFYRYSAPFMIVGAVNKLTCFIDSYVTW